MTTDDVQDVQAAGPAARRWRRALESWAIPEAVLDAAPESPYGFAPEVFGRSADEALAREGDTPSDRCSREALPEGGSLLDVGCGGGAGCVRLARRAGTVVGVDDGVGMLEDFAERIAALGAEVHTVMGRWPDVAAVTPLCDVVVCHHVVYNVADIGPFLARLSDHARHRVVIEAPLVHPVAWTTTYWQALHGLDRPDRPTLEDLLDVLHELGLEAGVERWRRPFSPLGEDTDEAIAALRRRLCVGPERDQEVADLLARHPPPALREVATLSWPGGRAVSRP